jgi:hypothetical protein
VLGLIQLGFNDGVAVSDDDVTWRANVDFVYENASPVDVLFFMSVCIEMWINHSIPDSWP